MKKICLFLTGLCFALSIPSGLTNQYDVTPGKKVKSRISIKNTSDETARYYIKKNDYTFQADGSNNYAEPGSIDRSNANWYELPEYITVGAGKNYELLFDIEIPASVEPVGTYWSLIRIGKEKPPADITEDRTVGLSIVTEYGIQIRTDFQEGDTKVDFIKSELIDLEGIPRLVVHMTNTADRWVRAKLKVQLFDSDGKFIKTYEGSQKSLYPGTSAEYTVDFPDTQDKKYKALVIADCGDDKVFGATFNLEF